MLISNHPVCAAVAVTLSGFLGVSAGKVALQMGMSSQSGDFLSGVVGYVGGHAAAYFSIRFANWYYGKSA
jgi:hypothetical protein